ncbi:MAG: sulfite exporter TauE/SafE family protein [Solirubrobacterales bacterium]|nr:sulfite exporter TauE/SafE family protein [Solirubrobacterales bacterium]
MGARVPSRSVRIALAAGSRRRGSRRSARESCSAGPGTSSSIAALPRDRLLKLAVIGTAAGAFSGLFGVGGGTVIVPLLVLWLGYGEREATGTSMAAIIVIAIFAVCFQVAYGNVDVADAALVGVPAIFGALAGTALQQRLPERAIALMFAVLLTAIAVELIIS